MHKRIALAGVCALVVAGCGSPGLSSPPSANGLGSLAAPAGKYAVLHSFGGSGDGAQPQDKLVVAGGKLYGTTVAGGAYGSGTVFEITPTGSEKVVYSFGAAAGDGTFPYGSLLNVNGVLYGTTSQGGKNNAGTVFSVTTSGKEKVIYSFDTTHGSSPVAAPIRVGAEFYGTTENGGSKGYGTVFGVTASGKERVLHEFAGGKDGALPHGSLILVKGQLYGTTVQGGSSSENGTVFAVSTAGKERVVHAFLDQGDGQWPYAALIDVGGKLYGTTSAEAGVSGGTLFSVTPSGVEHTVYHFTGARNGSTPECALVFTNGTFYGTTASGGYLSYGTAFAVTLAGKYRLLHEFGHGNDGQTPYAGFVLLGGKLYGTTAYGGANGAGTVFAITP